jgi:FixJ family two-component response regulator
VPTSLIIVIDDDQPVRESLADLLSAAGYKTAAFASAEEFLRSPQVEAFDCLISDVQLSGMSGLALVGALKAHGPSKPVILITARLDTDWRERASKVGAFCFLHKPFAAKALLDCVEASLKNRQS